MKSKEKYDRKSMPEKKHDKKIINEDSSKYSNSIDRNGMLCPKSVRNLLKKNEKEKEHDKSVKDKDNLKKDIETKYIVKKSVSTLNNTEKVVKVQKIDKTLTEISSSSIKTTKSKPNLIYSYSINDKSNKIETEKDKSKKHKKHQRSKSLGSENESKNLKKSKKHKKVKKRKHSESKEKSQRDESKNSDVKAEKHSPTKALPKSLLVSYSSDEEDESKIEGKMVENKVNSFVKEKTPETFKTEHQTSGELTIKSENKETDLPKNHPKIEIKLKPTKSPGKSAWESSDSEIEPELPHKLPLPSRSGSEQSFHSKTSESKISPKLNQESQITTEQPKRSKSRSRSRTRKSTASTSSSRSRSKSRSYSSSSNSKSYSDSDDSRSRSRSYSSRSRSKRKYRRRHHRRHRRRSRSSRSRRHHRHRKSSYSSSSRSSSRSRSYSSYSSDDSSRSRSSRYSRGRYYRKKRNSDDRSPKRYISSKTINHVTIPRQVEMNRNISQKIDAIKESQKKKDSSLNIPLPPEKPKNNISKPGPGEWCPSMDFGGPAPKKLKKNNNTIVTSSNTNTTLKADKIAPDQSKATIPLPEASTSVQSQSNYIGPQVSVDMAKKLGLDIKHAKKPEAKIMSDEYSTLDPKQLALQNLAIQHRLQQGLKPSTSEATLVSSAAYYQQQQQPYYVTPGMTSTHVSSTETPTVATSLSAVAAAQVQAAQQQQQAAMLQRLMSASSTPNVIPTAAVSASSNIQAAFQQQQAIALAQAQAQGVGGTVLANTGAGLVPISLMQNNSLQMNPVVLHHLQQQAQLAQLNQANAAISIPSQHAALALQQHHASQQAALLQSLGVQSMNAQPPQHILQSQAIKAF